MVSVEALHVPFRYHTTRCFILQWPERAEMGVGNSRRKGSKPEEIELPAADVSNVIEAVAESGLPFRKSLLGPISNALLPRRFLHRANNCQAARKRDE